MALPAEEMVDDDEDPLADAGFLTGLRNGWEALTDIAVIAATAVGALLPFAIVIALVLVPLMLWLRTSRRRKQPVTDPRRPPESSAQPWYGVLPMATWHSPWVVSHGK